MAANEQEIAQSVRAGTLSLDELRTSLSASATSTVDVQDWEATYSSVTGQLSVYCTVTATDPRNPITGLGLLAYSADGSKMYALQYSNGFNDTMIMTSIGTTLFTPSMGSQLLSVVYGWNESGSFYSSHVLNITQE
jgi:hypothetical protein